VKDQLDWRQRYYAPDPDQPAPRDYAKLLMLDDALILDVNVSFGTDATDDGRPLHTMSAASRVYRGDTFVPARVAGGGLVVAAMMAGELS